MKLEQQTIIPGSLTASDVDKIWEQFLEECKWMSDEGSEKEIVALTSRLARLKETRDALDRRIQEVNDQLMLVQGRKTEARAYLNEAARSLGKFASSPVLLQVLREKFPKLSRKAKDADPATPDESPGQESINKDKDKVLAVLDREGMHMAEVAKATELETWHLRTLLADLEKEGKVRTEGSRRSKRYMVVAEETA